MDKGETIFYNVPCTVWRTWLNGNVKGVLNDTLYCAVQRVYNKLEGIANEQNRWLLACDNLGCTIHDKEECLEHGGNLNDSGRGEAIFSIGRDMFWKFYKEYKSEEECTLLIAFLALKSIVGTEQYCKTTKQMWLSRVSGSTKQMHKLPKEVERFNKPYQIQKLKALLWKYYHVAFYSSSVHGFYFSTRLTMEELAREVKHLQKPSAIDEFRKAQLAVKQKVANDTT